MQQLDSIELFCLENELNIFDLLSENNGKPAFHSIDESKWNEFIASFINLDQYATVFKNGIQKISEKLTSVQCIPSTRTDEYDIEMKAPTVESVEKLKPIKIQSYNYIKYPTPSSLQAISSGFDTEKDDGSAPLVTDLDLYHLGLQIKHLPIYKLLQTANKTVLTDDWKFAKQELELLKLIGKFELLKENYLTETTHHGNQELLNEFFPDKLATAMHGRKKPARLDFVLAEIVWLATDFDQEKCYKTDQAKFISELIAGYGESCRRHLEGCLLPSKIKLEEEVNKTHVEDKLSTDTIFPRATSLADAGDVASSLFLNSPEVPVYGPPDPILQTHAARDFVSPIVFETKRKRKIPWLEIYKKHKMKLFIFSLDEDDQPKRLDQDMKIKSILRQEPQHDSKKASVAPWDPVEDECILSYIGILHRRFHFTRVQFEDQIFGRNNTHLCNWAGLVSEWLNYYCHSEVQIRSAKDVEARYRFLALQREKQIPIQSLPKSTANSGGSGNLHRDLNMQTGSTTNYATFPSLIPTGRRMNVEDKRFFSIREFERLMMAFMTMKKRPRLKPALHQIASSNVAQMAVAAASTPRQSMLSKSATSGINSTGSAIDNTEEDMDTDLATPAPSLLALLTNRKLNTSFHSSHESCVKKNAFLTGLHNTVYTASELALYKIQKNRILLGAPTPQSLQAAPQLAAPPQSQSIQGPPSQSQINQSQSHLQGPPPPQSSQNVSGYSVPQPPPTSHSPFPGQPSQFAMMSMASAQYQQQQQMQQQRQQQQIQQQQMQQQQQFQQHLYGMKQQGQVPTHGYHPGMAQSQPILGVPQNMATNILRPQPISTTPSQQAIHMGQQPINIGQHQPSHIGQQSLSATLGPHPMNITLGPQPINTSLGQQPNSLGQQQISPNNPSNISLGSTIRSVPRTTQPK